MSVLFRWIFFSSLIRIAGITIAIVAIFLIAESFDKSRFVGQTMTVGLLAEYLLLKIPLMISDFMPVVVLIASAIYITEISHHHELVAMRSSGVSLAFVLKPLLAAALCAGLFTFAVGEWVEPMTNARLATIERVHVQKKAPLSQGVQWLREGEQLMKLTPLTNDYFALMALKTDTQGRWLQRIDSDKASYSQGHWHMQKATISAPDTKQGSLISVQENFALASTISPTTVAPLNPRDMRWFDLLQFSRDLAAAGLASAEYVFQLHRKVASPLACLIMVILAYSLCANMGSRIAANSKGLALAVLIGFIFYVFSSTVVIIAGNIQLPIAFAAWWPNIMFAGIAGFLLLTKEGY